MQRRITGFHQDTEGHWVAELECGHSQHVRHDPPWQQRPWVLAEDTRAARLGSALECPLCDRPADDSSAGLAESAEELAIPAHLSPEARARYLDARVRGLCHEGALEVAERLPDRR